MCVCVCVETLLRASELPNRVSHGGVSHAGGCGAQSRHRWCAGCRSCRRAARRRPRGWRATTARGKMTLGVRAQGAAGAGGAAEAGPGRSRPWTGPSSPQPDSAVCPPHYSFTCSPRAPPPAGRRVGGKRARARAPAGASLRGSLLPAPLGLAGCGLSRERVRGHLAHRRGVAQPAAARVRPLDAKLVQSINFRAGGGNSQQNKTQQQASTRPSALGGCVLWKERRATISGSLLRPVRPSTPKALQSFTPRPKRPWANAF